MILQIDMEVTFQIFLKGSAETLLYSFQLLIEFCVMATNNVTNQDALSSFCAKKNVFVL